MARLGSCMHPPRGRSSCPGVRTGQSDAGERPDIYYNLLPRKLQDFQPYSMEDYRGQNYNPKEANYWRLGGLGCGESEELKVGSLSDTGAGLGSSQSSAAATCRANTLQLGCTCASDCRPPPPKPCARQLIVRRAPVFGALLRALCACAGQAAEAGRPQEPGQADQGQEHERGSRPSQASGAAAQRQAARGCIRQEPPQAQGATLTFWPLMHMRSIAGPRRFGAKHMLSTSWHDYTSTLIRRASSSGGEASKGCSDAGPTGWGQRDRPRAAAAGAAAPAGQAGCGAVEDPACHCWAVSTVCRHRHSLWLACIVQRPC